MSASSEITPRQLLDAVVKEVVGSENAQPRPGQLELMDDITAAFSKNPDFGGDTGGHALALAPTGTGKSFSALVPAMIAALDGQRTVISTESLALQDQIEHKDAPAVSRVLQSLGERKVKTAVFKGWSNYVCLQSAIGHAQQLLGDDLPDKKQPRVLPEKQLGDLADRLVSQQVPDSEAVVWALTQGIPAVDAVRTGDRASFDGTLSGDTWEALSVDTESCLGKDCPMVDLCLPRMVRRNAANADIIVTNHSMLAVQAAMDVPVVIGSRTLGPINHLVVDECHALPDKVRSHGSSRISMGAVLGLIGALNRTILNDTEIAQLSADGRAIADAVDAELEAALRSARSKAGSGAREGDAIGLGDSDTVLPNTETVLVAWAKKIAALAGKIMSKTDEGSKTMIPLRRLAGRANQLVDSVNMVSTPRPGYARWLRMETNRSGRTSTVAEAAPVDVSPMLRNNLWRGPAPTDPEVCDKFGIEPRPDEDYFLNVVCMSATVPAGYDKQTGLHAGLKHYRSPFDAAYAASALYIPVTDDKALAELSRYGSSKPTFDASQHAQWAVPQIVQLVEANRGSALVLSATATSGKMYADVLRSVLPPGIRVLSQWDGPTTGQLAREWKDDPTAVLVGTRSLMAGIDAPGDTNTLVIVDRVPRSAGNPVDDARVKDLVERGVYSNKWTADEFVYVADAALLLEQSAGRLIRRESDRGMVAVLDPRLLKTSPFVYRRTVRDAYMDGLMKFGTKLKTLDDAKSWLTKAADGREPSAA